MVLNIWYYASTLPEYEHSFAAENSAVTSELTLAAIRRIATLTTTPQLGQWRRTLDQLKHLVHWFYTNCVSLRPVIRSQIGAQLLAVHHYKGSTNGTGSKFSVQGTDAGSSRAHVSHLLEILCVIIGGLTGGNIEETSTDMECASSLLQLRAVSELLSDVLMPLHTPNEMVEWRDQVPVVQGYHEVLVRCVVRLVERDRLCTETHKQTRGGAFQSVLAAPVSVLTQALKALLRLWPDGYQTNTPKQVLLLHELEMLLELTTLEEFSVILQPLMTRLVKCIGSESDNIRPAQRALQFFKNDKILSLIAGKSSATPPTSEVESEDASSALRSQVVDKCLTALLPALYREGHVSWNPSVNKMTALALRNIKERNEPAFKKHCELLFGSAITPSQTADGDLSDELSVKRVKLPSAPRPMFLGEKVTTPVADSASGDSIPPPTGARKPLPLSSHGGAMLPPRAINISSRPPAMGVGTSRGPTGSVPTTHFPRYSASNPPPVTITGVAPWAKMPAVPATTTMLIPPDSLTSLQQQRREQKVREAASELEANKAVDGYSVLLAYMERCYPAAQAAEQCGSHVNEWSAQQAAVSPTLLPSLRFHDLVFGRQLGEGAFSTVKYARLITRDKTQSAWPEFAVKIVSSAKIREHQYMSSVVREMAALQMLSHPGIARLVSTFRYRDSAYLVLEYAAKGDLHSYLVSHGKMAHLQTRFVIGEVTAALLSIHELGFCFNDLKPENILITEIGHIKLADFGACRPITQDARDLLQRSKSVLSNIRNGDWRDPPAGETTEDLAEPQADEELFQDDDRVEGTPGYLPPEVLSGRASLLSKDSDAWALGCVTRFCLHGRPLYFGDKEEVLEQIRLNSDSLLATADHKVHFLDEEETKTASEGDLKNDEAQRDQDAAAKDFVDGLTRVDRRQRLTTQSASQHAYLTSGLLSSSLLHDNSACPQTLSPLSLHSSAPIALPTKKKRVSGEEGGSGGAQDELWARRQFSRLWAPMPSEYALDEEEGGDVASRSKPLAADGSASELWLQSHPHRLTPIAEL
eukprot:gene29535-36601_t